MRALSRVRCIVREEQGGWLAVALAAAESCSEQALFYSLCNAAPRALRHQPTPQAMEILLEKMEQEAATEKAMVDLDAEVYAPSMHGL